MKQEVVVSGDKMAARREGVTAVEVDGADELQVRVDPPDAVHVAAVLQAGPDRRLVQEPGFALQPEEPLHHK